MNIQLNYQGQLIGVPIQDEDAKCQYLYDYAQNGFQCQVQLIYTLPSGRTGEVDPSWSIIAIVQAGGQFSVNPIQQGENITINIFVQDQPITQLNLTQQQTLKEVLDLANQNMQTQYQELELYDQQGNELSNTLTDIFGQFKQAQQPFLLFIPKCQSGIQNFVQQVDTSLVNAPQQQQLLIEVYYQNQKSAELAAGPEQIMEELLLWVNQNTGQQDITFEIYDAQGNFLSNNQQDTFGKYVQNQQPLKFYVPMCEQQNDKQSPIINNNQQQQIQAGGQFSVNPIQQGENIMINIFVQDQPITQLNFTQQQTLKEVLDLANQNMQTQYQELELYDQQGNKLSNTLTDIFGQFKQAQQPFLLFIPKSQSGIQNFVQQVDPSLVNAPQQQQLLIEVYYQNQKSAELAAGPEQIMEELLLWVNLNTGQQDITFEIYDAQGNFLSNNQQDTFGQYVQNQQPLKFYVPMCEQQNDNQSPNLQNNELYELQLKLLILKFVAEQLI